jgi:hypothetical protein
MLLGLLMLLSGLGAWAFTSHELGAQDITVPSDARWFQGAHVRGPLTAFAQSDIIQTHALHATEGRTFAQMEQGDPIRDVAMNASFLRASLFTSILAFGLSLLSIGLGTTLMIIGHALMKLSPRRVGSLGAGAAGHPAVVDGGFVNTGYSTGAGTVTETYPSPVITGYPDNSTLPTTRY